MAKSLNKSRMHLTRLAIVLSVLVVLFTRETFSDEEPLHDIFDLAGILLVAICAMGRIYCTAFLGGNKNVRLVTYGPFSVVRNPLYVFSLLGITGIALMSNHLLIMIVLPMAFLALYDQLIKREEAHLHEVFGAEFDSYCRAVPRLWPRFKSYVAPERIETSPKLLWIALRDATMWFIPYQIFELVEFLHESNLIALWN